jgi:hypothetical protein
MSATLADGSIAKARGDIDRSDFRTDTGYELRTFASVCAA